jgi:hypothetical protein
VTATRAERVGQVVGTAIGAPLVLIGVWGLVDNLPGDQLRSFVTWFAAGLLVHDLVWLPVALCAGGFIGTRVDRRVRRPLAWAMGASAALIAVAMPFVWGFGRRADTPSLLPRNYGRGLLVYLGLIVAIAVCWAASTARTGSDHESAEENDGEDAQPETLRQERG